MKNQTNNERFVTFQHEETKLNTIEVMPWHNSSVVPNPNARERIIQKSSSISSSTLLTLDFGKTKIERS